MCLLMFIVSSFVSSRLNAEDAAARPGSGDPTRAGREMRHLLPANVKEIRDACPGVSCEFILQQIEAGATIFDAKDAYYRLLSERLDHLAQENAKLRAGQRAERSLTALPIIRLLSKVVTDKKSGVVSIEIGKQIYRIRQGQQVAITAEGLSMQIVAEDISEKVVRLHVMPQNVRMEL
jgi:hypothetical protein